jgi:T-complex protein 1 subunit eta
MLLNCASTSLNSKLVSGNKEFFSNMLVDAIENIEGFAQGTISVRQVSGGSITESCLINGVAFKKCFSYAGFEQQPKNFSKPTILCLNVELELKAEKDNAEVRITDPSKYQSIVDAEWKII